MKKYDILVEIEKKDGEIQNKVIKDPSEYIVFDMPTDGGKCGYLILGNKGGYIKIMYVLLIEIEKKDGKIIKKFIKDPSKYTLFNWPGSWGKDIYLNLKEIIFYMCDISEIEKIKTYIIYHDVITWDCDIMFLIINKAKYNLTKKIEFLTYKKSEKIYREEFQKQFPELKFQPVKKNKLLGPYKYENLENKDGYIKISNN